MLSIRPTNPILHEPIGGVCFALMKDKAITWRLHLQRQLKSSQTIQAYCGRHNLSTGMFYYWKRKLSASVEQSSFLEVEVPSPLEHTPVIEVHLYPPDQPHIA